MKRKVAAYCRVSTKKEIQQYSLSGKIKCGECGCNYRRITTHSGEIVWRCAGRVEKNGTCKAETIKQSDIDKKLHEKFAGELELAEMYKMINNISVIKGEIVVE